MSKLMLRKGISVSTFDRSTDSVKYLPFSLLHDSKSSTASTSSSSSISYFLLIIVLLYISPLVQLYPNCKCVKFIADQTTVAQGVFTSPDWPKPYDPGIDCLLYIFIGKSGQLIEISFDSFDVYASPTSSDCLKSDYVRVLLNPQIDEDGSITHKELESPVNHDTQVILCGKSIDEWKRRQYSFDSLLLIQFHSSTSGPVGGQSHGFSGTYRFIEGKSYKTDGAHLLGSTCDYQFLSISSSDTTENTPRVGKFFSPNYPNRYPSKSMCAYHFMGKYNERVKIVFERIIFGNTDSSCLDTNDVILVYDGPDMSSPLIAQLCNNDKFAEIISSGPDLHVIFYSGSVLSPLAKGFQALYSFNQTYHSLLGKNNNNLPPSSPTTSLTSLPSSPSYHHHHQHHLNHLNHFNQKQREHHIHHSNQESSDETKLSSDETKFSQKSFSCDQTFNSELTLNGSFHSPNHPDPYPSGIRCRYYFNGHGKQRVQIMFNDFDLVKGSFSVKPTISCESSDTLMVLLTINGNKESLDNFCGSKRPNNLMSNGPNLLIEFRSGHYEKRKKVKGFHASYRFVTNFGINSGEQDTKKVCSFIFNSTLSPNGTISSPNFPGFYPRNTECQYFFHGKPNEQVHLNFQHFDIEGVPPCAAESASDYIELSNYPSVDRKLPRHCGFRKPKSIISDHEYFRVVFKSNDKFDGTGFEALYSFRNARKDSSGARRLTNDGIKVKSDFNWITVILILIILTENI